MSENPRLAIIDYGFHLKRAGDIFIELQVADIEDSRSASIDIDGLALPRTVPSTNLLEVQLDIELEAMIRTNPKTSNEEKNKQLTWFKKLQDKEEAQRIGKIINET